ncbi:glycosyltransferase family 4 protein [Rubrivirga sp.]|uniref:glycosyltransferase family 4 protein n=1 Tax=Rubrivirga sp. TaxID=1885344 RepID=UPI003C74042D
MRRPRLVLGAFICHPFRGSEPTVGWNRAVESSKFGEVHVITKPEDNERAVRDAVRDQGLEGLHFHFVPPTALEDRLMSTPGLYYSGYRRWQWRAYLAAKEMHERAPFDLAHHVNMCGFREPGYLWKLDIPFVWGPVGGTQNTPAAFVKHGGAVTTVIEGTRTVLNEIQLRASPRVRRAAAAASVVLAANSTGKRDLEAALGLEVRQLLETGVRSVGEPKRWADRVPGPVRVLWAGALEPRKRVGIAVEAIRRVRELGLEVELIVVGDGPERHLVDDVEGVDARGQIPRADLLDLYADADMLAFTSVRDTSGNVMLEALAAGLPVVYLDHQGAADMGSAECGVPVPVTSPEHVVEGVAQALSLVASDPALYDRLSAGAIARAEELRWTRNGAALNAIYAEVLGHVPDVSGDGVPHVLADYLVPHVPTPTDVA